MNIQVSACGKVGHLFRCLFPKNAILPVLLGPLSGFRWIMAAGNVECFLGTYEKKKVKRFTDEITDGMVIYDIGAHVGYYTLLASRGNPNGKVVSFEPSLRNFPYLQTHMVLNHCKNVELVNAAVSNVTGKTLFKMDITSGYEGMMSNTIGDTVVSTVCIDELVNKGKLAPPNLLKIDAEGSEGLILDGSIQTITKHRPKIFLATHGSAVHNYCVNLLSKLKYSMEPLDNPELLRATEILAKFYY